MAEKEIKRLHPVKTLYEMLPPGAEGGKEFARIVDLLLFHEARRAGKKLTLFSDSAGDYYGLDSFEGDVFRKHGTIGYQYKFYPTPLSDNHRGNIEQSLKQTAENQKKLKLKKWILVTPGDMVESSTRKSGGDITWFESLRKKLKLKFELEHWGHKKLLSLFLETPAICLFYYPQLVPEGAARRKTIQETRKIYDDNLNTLHRKIEFVGMPVYKPEATQGVHMEHIYIPLTAVPEQADENAPNVSRINPLSFLTPGARHMVLGDPGSGKSTMQKFLALAGQSEALQKRYNAEPDNRLPIFITLRRYADELKSRKNLSLIDYILENVQGDFNLKSADLDFFEYYLESGQAILLFDGLDELPGPHFKKDVVNRIRTLITTYPGNTVVVTSRIVGYDSAFRFDNREFSHYRLTNLQLPEIEQFVRDWYAVRIDNPKERDEHANDLIGILQEKEHEAIGELAQNPLLLTIIALVHRIDAVLPDERVVLYQKCTETLLNTWHTWKFRDTEIKHRGKVERRNRKRMEAIAYWMHCQSISAKKNQRAVVPYNALKDFLTSYIAKSEIYRNLEEDPEDMASEFLEFVKKRAGLLIEIGDNEYSFVHLTFQEYLAASNITTTHEKDGVKAIWELINRYRSDDRWLEVIRLLIANLKSDESQAFLVEKLIEANENENRLIKSRLLGGLLMDGIEPAEFCKDEIFQYLLHSAIKIKKKEEPGALLSMIRTCLSKENVNKSVMYKAFASIWQSLKGKKQKIKLILTATSLNWSETKIRELTGDFLTTSEPDTALYKIFFTAKPDTNDYQYILKNIELLCLFQDHISPKDPYFYFYPEVLLALCLSLEENYMKKAFEQQMGTLASGVTGSSPFSKFNMNSLYISRKDKNYSIKYAHARALALDRALDRDMGQDLKRDLASNQVLNRIRDLNLDRTAWTYLLHENKVMAQLLILILDKTLAQKKSSEDFWNIILSKPRFYNSLLYTFFIILGVKTHTFFWIEALRVNFLPKIPERITLFDESKWKQVEQAFEKGNFGETEVYSAAWQLMFDSWLYIFGNHNTREESIFEHLAQLTQNIDAPPLRIAHCIRDLAYGDKSRANDLAAMVNSNDPRYREIFERCLWIPTEEEKKKGKRKAKK